jgi:penicillin-binding protein 1A
MTGAKTALPIWIDLMATAHTDKEVSDFYYPPSTQYLSVDLKTQTLSNGFCPEEKILLMKGSNQK